MAKMRAKYEMQGSYGELSCWKKQEFKFSKFLKLGFSHCKKQHWIINVQTFIHLMRLSLCSKDS